jgi:WhiB family transcriptional regulator, redox-sensing transcriptional regulator
MTACMNWRDAVACRDADPDLFFPIGTTGAALRQAEEAKRICRSCPVQIHCLAWALDSGVTDGVWGATTPDERRVIRSLSARNTAREEDDNDNGYRPERHAERGIRAQAAP